MPPKATMIIDQQPELNKIGARPEGRLTVFRTTQQHKQHTKCATTKDSLFYGQQNNCIQGYEAPTVKGQFDDAEDSHDIKDEEKDAALTLLNASKISAAGCAKSTTFISRIIENNGVSAGSRSINIPVTQQYHRSQHSQHQHYNNYHPPVLGYPRPPNIMPIIKSERQVSTMRELMVPSRSLPVSSGVGGTMPRHAGPPQRSSLPSPDESLSASKVIDGVVWERSNPAKSSLVYCPNPADVLFGRGGAVNTHPGNIFFRSQVTYYHNQYVKARNHAEKSCVVRCIRDAIRMRGGRFLRCKTASKVWCPVDERDATVKTMQSLRDVKTFNEGGEILSGISSHSTDTFSSKTDATESNNHHENTDGNLNRNNKGVSVGDASCADQGYMMTNTSVTSTPTVHRRLPSSSLPSKKRPITLERIYTEPPSREFVEQACKKIKRDLPTSKTLGCTPPPPTVTTRPTQEIPFIATPTPRREIRTLPLKKVTFHKEPPHSSNDYINFDITVHHQQQQQKQKQQQQQQQQQQILLQEQQFPPMSIADFKDIALLRPEDVLSGRGGGTNRHPGNIHFRQVVSQAQPNYIKSRKKDKSIIARNIVASIRAKNGRFLKFHAESGLWHDVGNKKATEKTSQALREGLAGCNGSGDDATVVTNSDGSDSSNKKGSKTINLQTQNRLSVRTVSSESASLSGESQETSFAPNWHTGIDSGIGNNSFLKNGNGAAMHQLSRLQQWGRNCNKGQGLKMGIVHNRDSYLSRVVSSTSAE